MERQGFGRNQAKEGRKGRGDGKKGRRRSRIGIDRVYQTTTWLAATRRLCAAERVRRVQRAPLRKASASRLNEKTHMDRSNHYEAAFEPYLRQRRLCFIAVD